MHAQLLQTLCDPMDCGPPCSSVLGFSRQEYQSGLPCPPPGELPNPGIKARSPTLQADSLPSEPPGKPRILEWGAFPFSRGSSQPRDQSQVSRIAGRFFTSWATILYSFDKLTTLSLSDELLYPCDNFWLFYLSIAPPLSCGYNLPWISFSIPLLSCVSLILKWISLSFF